MAPKPIDFPARSPSKRWSSILTQPSIFRKSSADHIHRFSTVDTAGPSSDVKRMFRAKRFSSAGDTPYDDPWEMRSLSCCEFDRLRNNLALDNDPENLDALFHRLFNLSLVPDLPDDRELTSDSDTVSSFEDQSSLPDSAALPAAQQPIPKLSQSVSLSSIPAPTPPPKPARSSRRPRTHRISTSLTTLNEHPNMEQSLSHTDSARVSPALSRLSTPPLEPSRSALAYLASNHSSGTDSQANAGPLSASHDWDNVSLPTPILPPATGDFETPVALQSNRFDSPHIMLQEESLTHPHYNKSKHLSTSYLEEMAGLNSSCLSTLRAALGDNSYDPSPVIAPLETTPRAETISMFRPALI